MLNAKNKGKARFSDKSGNQWSGRGPRPGWLREALQAGHDINEFRIGNRAKPKKNLIRLGKALPDATTNAGDKPMTPTKRVSKARYADDAGHAWSGMGPKPTWLKSAIESGKLLADFEK